MIKWSNTFLHIFVTDSATVSGRTRHCASIWWQQSLPIRNTTKKIEIPKKHLVSKLIMPNRVSFRIDGEIVKRGETRINNYPSLLEITLNKILLLSLINSSFLKSHKKSDFLLLFIVLSGFGACLKNLHYGVRNILYKHQFKFEIRCMRNQRNAIRRSESDGGSFRSTRASFSLLWISVHKNGFKVVNLFDFEITCEGRWVFFYNS